MESIAKATQQNVQTKYGQAAKKNIRDDAKQTSSAKKEWNLPTDTYEPSMQVQKTKATKTQSSVEDKLSDRAKKVLEQLKQKYVNMDFFIADYSSDEEAQSYLRKGTKEYSVLIDPETLEQMASDDSVRKNYEDVLSGAGNRFQELKDKLGETGDSVKRFGISIDSDGKVSYFAELDKITESRKNQVEKAKAKRAEKKEMAEKQEEIKERRSRYTVKADSIDELVEKIQEKEENDKKNSAVSTFDVTL